MTDGRLQDSNQVSASTSVELTGASPARRHPTLLSKTAWSALASLLNTVGSFVSGIVVARTLGPTVVGTLAYIVWLVSIANVLTNLGLQSSLTRYLAELHG